MPSVLEETLIVVPIYDEWPHVISVLDGLRELCPHVLVIEDGATESSLRDYAMSSHIGYVPLPFNMGAWAAIQTGFKYALAKGYKKVVTFDGDGQHLPEEILKVLAPLDHGYDIVIGSCVGRAGFLRKTCWLILRTLSGLKIDDVTSGFRAYGWRAFERFAQFSHVNLEYQDVGVLILANRWGFKLGEVRIQMSERLGGRSKVFPGIRSIAKYFLVTMVSVLIKWR